MPEPLAFTTGRWFNKEREDGGFAKTPAYREGFTYAGFAYGTDTPEHFTPAGAPLQLSLICSFSAAFLAIDVDYPDNLAESATGKHVSWADAISVRGSHFHIGIDMRGVPESDWPVQGRTAWGDVKAAGFIPVPGSVHYSGEVYKAAPEWESKVIRANPELLAALRADREEHAMRRLAAARTALGMSTGTRLPDGAYLYASGYVGGTWQQLPDGALAHDDELKDLVWDMGVEYGRPEAEVRQQWERLNLALGTDWTERDFQRHWHRVPGKRMQREDEENWTETAFGLSGLAEPWEAARRQQQAAADNAVPNPEFPGARPPQPPPDWGFEVPRTDYMPLWLGTGAFSAEQPTDADNALAVLQRAHQVLRFDEEAGTWLLRGTGRWDSFTGQEAPRGIINALRERLPYGCADPLKHPSHEHLDPEADAAEIAALKRHAKNRERFSASGTVGAVAQVMRDIVMRYRGAGATVRSSELDADPEVLWAGGVPWDLRASLDGPVAAAVDRNEPHLKTAPVVPDLSVPTPLWHGYCQAVFPDPEGREWALNVFAAAFTGYADAVMPVLLGETRLGKTFLVNLLTSVLGDYGGVMSGDLLKADARLHGSFTLKLKGMRLAFVDEAPGKSQASQEHLKKITGGGKMEGNKMRENPVEFFPTHTLVLAANKERMPDLTEDALRTRARVIRFDGDRSAVSRAAAALGRSVNSAQWKAEMPGVLAQMMRRAAQWLADRSIADTERSPYLWQMWADDTIGEQDPFRAWLTSGEILYDQRGSSSLDLHEHFTAWCRRHGERSSLERVPFGIALAKAGYESRKSHGTKWWPLKVAPMGAAEFMGRGSAPEPSPGTPNPPPTVPTRFSRSSGDSSLVGDGGEGRDTTNTHNTHTRTHTQDANSGKYPPHPPNHPPTLVDLGKRTAETLDGTVPPSPEPSPAPGTPAPAGLEKNNRLENGENGKTAENRVSPLKPKTPRTRLTPEEKQERLEARKAENARQRLDARSAKIAELGGKPVSLPAVVLRDQAILEVTPAEARAWLSGVTELSVDTESTAFPVGHRHHALRLVQLGNEHSAVVLDPVAQADVIRDAVEAARVLHAHSAHADLVPLEHAGLCGPGAWAKMTDTLLLAKLTDPALSESDEAALKPLAKKLLGADYALSWKLDALRREIFAAGGWLGSCEAGTPLERSGWAMIPLCEAFVRYAASDVMDCAAVARVLS